MSSKSNLLARLAEIMRQQQQQPRDLTVEDEDDIDAHYTMTEDELAEARQRFWERIADPHGGDGIVLKEDPKTLDTCDLAGIAKYLKRGSGYGSGKLKVVVMAGAGISTSAGIPDFRSPKTGLYANLARLNLPYPEAVFDIHYFKENPLPFYTLAHELYPGNFRPTVTHSFIKLLADKGMLQICFTQNIDTLERLAGVPADKLVEAHGSFAENHCIDCGAEFPADEMRELVLAPNPSAPGGVNIPRCKVDGCNGLVKPDIVFFGESLPERFHESLSTLPFADLAIVMGTSLKVHPFARLPEMVSDRCPRVLMNMEVAGHFERADDVIHLAPCDEAIRELCDLLGWRDELEQAWAATEGLVDTSRPVKPPAVVEQEPSKIQVAKNAVEAGNMKDLADMLANRLKLEADSSSQPSGLAEAEKNVEKVAKSTAAAMDSSVPPAARKATASIRVSLAWVPEPAPIPDEESVLVLTAPTGQYVDIRIKLPAPTDATVTPSTDPALTNPPDRIPPNSTLSWAFAGLVSRTPDGKGGRWSRVVDSRTPVIDPAGEADEGQEETLPNGDTKEWGTMDGKEYVEVWRSLDMGESPETWVSEKDKDGTGMVVRVGNRAQGVTRQGGELSAFRAWSKDGKWEDVYRVGPVDAFPQIGGSKDGWKVANAGETKL